MNQTLNLILSLQSDRKLTATMILSHPYSQSSSIQRELLSTIKRISSTNVLISTINRNPAHSSQNSTVCGVKICKKQNSGRVLNQIFNAQVLYSNDTASPILSIHSVVKHEHKWSEISSKTDQKSKTVEETDENAEILKKLEMELPFRIGLNQSELQSKQNVMLPYEHQDINQANKALELHPQQLQLDYSSSNNSTESSENDDEWDTEDDIDV